MRRTTLPLLLLLLVVARALPVLALGDVFYYGEELPKSAATKAILDGLDVPYHHLNYMPHEGGGFVVIHLRMLWFALVGPSLLAVKLTALTTSLLILAAGYRVARHWFGDVAALIFGLLFVLAPRAVQCFSLLSTGTHFESVLFLVLVLHLGARAAFEERGHGAHLLLGLAVGFGTYFSYQTVAIAIPVAAAILWTRRRALLDPRLGSALAGVALGALPLWLTLAAGAGEAGQVRDVPLFASLADSAGRAAKDVVVPLRENLGGLGWLAFALHLGLIAYGGLAVVRDGARRSVYRLTLAYVLVFCVFFFFAGLSIGGGTTFLFFLRWSGVWLAGTLLVAAVLARMMAGEAPGVRWGARAALAFLLLLGVVETVRLTAGGRASLGTNVDLLLHTKGYEYQGYLDHLVHRMEGNLAERLAVLAEYDDDDEMVLPAVVAALIEGTRLKPADGVKLCRTLGDERAQNAMLGLGGLHYRRAKGDIGRAIALLNVADPDAPLHARAIGRFGTYGRPMVEYLEAELAVDAPPRWRAEYHRGLGYRVYRIFQLDPDGAEAFLSKQAPAVEAALRAGYEETRRAWRLD